MAAAWARARRELPMQPDSASTHWFALQVHSGRESLAALVLRHKGYEEFLPVQKRPGKRRKETAAPLFPGYLFCRLGVDVLGPIVTTPGVIRIVGCGPRPAPIHEDEIASLRRISDSGLPRQPHPYLAAGTRVRVTNGPLAGAGGILLRQDRRARLVVEVTLLQRAVVVDLDPSWVVQERKEAACGPRSN